jgi:hypothetical protein
MKRPGDRNPRLNRKDKVDNCFFTGTMENEKLILS